MDERLASLTARIALAFRERSFELFLVGGALRDMLLDRDVRELDFATNARPDETAAVLNGLPGASVYRLGEKFGTVAAVFEDGPVEITTYRSAEVYEQGSRKPEVCFGESIDEDLERRDFTINALALDAADVRPGLPAQRPGAETYGSAPEHGVGASFMTPGALIDRHRGAADLVAKIVRAVGDPDARFAEDPLRLLRAVRFGSSLAFDIEPATWAAIQRSAPRLESISRERIFEELNRMLVGPCPAAALTLLRDGGLLGVAAPQLMALDSMPDHGPRHSLSLWDHTMRVLDGVPPDLALRWAALIHDIGKTETRSFDQNGRIRFAHHEEVGAGRAVEILRSLRASNELTNAVEVLILTHMHTHAYSDTWSDGAVRRLRHRLDTNFNLAVELAKADSRGHGDTPWGLSKIEALVSRAQALDDEAPQVTSPLTGDEIMDRYGLAPGPLIGTVKDALTEQVMEGRLRYDDRESAWREADRIIAGARE